MLTLNLKHFCLSRVYTLTPDNAFTLSLGWDFPFYRSASELQPNAVWFDKVYFAFLQLHQPIWVDLDAQTFVCALDALDVIS